MATATVVECDVVIIGGGVQGLWLLNDLSRDYSVVLLESHELGGGQTGHAQVYLHRGYAYAQTPYVNDYQSAWALWDAWLKGRNAPRSSGALFGFTSDIERDNQRQLWDSVHLRQHQIAAAPPALQRGLAASWVQTPEFALNSRWLAGQLSQGLNDRIIKADRMDALEYDVRDGRSTIRCISGAARLTVRGQGLVCSSGNNNESLMSQIGGLPQPIVCQAQRGKDALMLVVRGPTRVLPELTGACPESDFLFIVSRSVGNETVWLVSNNQGWKDHDQVDWDGRTADEWTTDLLTMLSITFPGVWQERTNLSWGRYEGTKAHMDMRQLGMLNALNPLGAAQVDGLRIWTAWPFRLTFAPSTSAVLAQAIRKEIGHVFSQPSNPANPVGVGCADERWRSVALQSWLDFTRQIGSCP